ncbi:SusC/RagA family TonB-linked outer membrane protein [Galbibacter sp. BG1]|uniref:SusC/RagA family TonB-linked outer membrane protein n=1 Tax=Galbibacter sp. BG1 TaxID=1170699 RepID=UPI0015BADEDE|nr:SusC/RagA family TonB-linked outer membrane protein [Galbibacter sp. BG1]QLE02444.1 SusC/RagA family TonB-linked outer membrane protein [Galbibacter sp. BG1]
MKRTIILNFILILMSSLTWAQNQSISGNVSDIEGNPLPGVTVIVENTNTGTMTDFNGNYTIEASRGASLNFRYIGFEPKTIKVATTTTIDVVLKESTEQLEEVVITAMGIKREAKSVVNAQQSIAVEGLQEARSSNFVSALSGKAAGVQVTNSQTASGSNRVVIRGITSLSGNNQPLYVLDGVPLDQTVGDAQSGSWGGGDYAPVDYGDPVSNLNPDDIENIEVLKGASASALYGSRASNGVILITTKKGKKKKGWGVTLTSNTMIQEVNQYPDYQYVYGSGAQGSVASTPNHLTEVDGETYAEVNSHINAFGGPLLGYNVFDYNNTIGPYSPRPNNVKELFKTGTTIISGVQLDKATDKATVRIGYTHTGGEWVMDRQDQINRHNLSLRATAKLTDKLSVDGSMYYTNDNITNRVVENGSFRNPAQNFIQMHPSMYRGNLTPWKDENGQATRLRAGSGWLSNPYWNIYENLNEDKTDRIISKFQVNYEILKGWDITAKVNGDLRLTEGFRYEAPGATYDRDGSYFTFNQNITNWNFEGITTYRKNINNFSLVSVLGANQWKFNYSRRTATVNELLFPDVYSLSNSAGDYLANEADSERVLNSVFGSLNVGYKSFIYLDATARNEWSSTLSLEDNSYLYGSFGGSLIFSEFIKKNNIFSFGKLRASIAEVGNSAAPYQVYDTYAYGGNYQNIAWVSPLNQKNKTDLKNETTRSFEMGLETKFFKNRFSANVTYYKTNSFDQILSGPVTPVTGYTTSVLNAGEITNEGWEVFANAKILDGPFSWSMDLNWSTNESFVKEIDPQVPRITLNQWGGNLLVVAEENEPYGNIRGVAPVYDEESGQALINPFSGLPVWEADQILGNFQPDWLGSINNSFSYKGISLNFLIEMKKGGELYSASYARQNQFGTHASTLPGREEFIQSARIYGESENERAGQGLNGNDYNRGDRVQGAIAPGVIAEWGDPDGDGEFGWVSSGEQNNIYLSPDTYYFNAWFYNNRSIFDASYIKLREVTMGYQFPQSILKNTPFTNAKISFVGRNLWIIHQNTPKGLDPEANSTSGNGQGIEFGSFLPSRSMGVNINLSF